MPSPAKAAALMALALILAAMGIYSAIANDRPGGAVGGFLLMLVAVVIGVRATRNRLPVWARRGALVVGVLIAAPAAFVTHAAAIAAPLFGQPADVPVATEVRPLAAD
jgi:predicted Kef-type K+ transport protein